MHVRVGGESRFDRGRAAVLQHKARFETMLRLDSQNLRPTCCTFRAATLYERPRGPLKDIKMGI